MYSSTAHAAAIVAYGTSAVSASAATATAQMAGPGERRLASTRRNSADAGSPPSRAKAYAIRDADVTVASPHRYWATPMPTNSAVASPPGNTALSAVGKAS